MQEPDGKISLAGMKRGLKLRLLAFLEDCFLLPEAKRLHWTRLNKHAAQRLCFLFIYLSKNEFEWSQACAVESTSDLYH